MRLNALLAAALIVGTACTSVNAATDTVTVNVSGTLTRPPCTLTSSKTLTVNFGTMRADQITAAPMVDIPVTLTCPANSALSISVKASSVFQGSTTQASAGKANLAYLMYWKGNNSAVNVTGEKRSLTNQSGTVDLSMKAKLTALGTVSEGAFSASSVISIEYL
ncbi:fimbrial protein [Pseudomonas lundensis]|uniref:Fimbrial protein n=1 Tax=Pseudomonas lundensis TaxID=86185 RepID=A0A266N615_9PSED|nr:spore coat protein U domain-containing protein [Pseudomonas lundensis]OZY57931.1 fimbrial protein [Pseudomonas lundensis]